MRALCVVFVVSRTVGGFEPSNFALRRPWQQHTPKASTDAASEAVGRIDDAPAQTDGAEASGGSLDDAAATLDPVDAAEDTAAEDADVLRALEDEVNRLVDAHEQYEATIERLSSELDAAQTARAETTRDYERAYNRYQQMKGIQDMFRKSGTDQPG